MIAPVAQVAAVPETTPFVAPEELARRVRGAPLLRLGANESAFGPSPRAIAKMAAELPHLAWYGDPESYELREALAARHHCAVENLSVGAGIDDLLGLAVRAYVGPSGVAVTTRGSYATFDYQVRAHGAGLETVPYSDDCRPDLNALAAAARRLRPALVYLANPDNPSGYFHERDAIDTFRRALPAGTVFLLDEAYADFVARDRLLPDEIDPNMLRMRTFSKAYGLAGARVAYVIATPAAVATFQKIRVHFAVNRNAQIGALEALRDESHITAVVRDTMTGRRDYEHLASSYHLATLPSDTNFVCFDLGSRTRAERFLTAMLELGVFIRKPGVAPLDRYVRVTVGNAADRARFASCFPLALERCADVPA